MRNVFPGIFQKAVMSSNWINLMSPTYNIATTIIVYSLPNTQRIDYTRFKTCVRKYPKQL